MVLQLIPEGSKPDQQTRREASAPPAGESRAKWVLTKEALDKLLDRFSPDREEAGKQFEAMRVKLVRYFEWRSSALPDRDADETIDRVARRIGEGEDIINLNGYFLSVARLVSMESQREHERTPVGLDDIPETPANMPAEDDQKEARMRCLDECLAIESIESRNLILDYYYEDRRAKIDRRKLLAEALHIPMNALRIRAHRIRVKLEGCIDNCIGRENFASK